MAYSAWNLLGKRLSFTVDLSQAECGCNAAFYLVSMRQNAQPGKCGGDFYCDANSVCGVACAEIDLLEGNRHAFHTTVQDKEGTGSGLGGTFGTRAFDASAYGPGPAHTIDTTQPFRVSAYFDTSGGAWSAGDLHVQQLTAIEMTLTGASGRELRFTVSSSHLGSLTPALAAGMTPTASFWSSEDLG